jgi:uracil phosphoribosyltransferase
MKNRIILKAEDLDGYLTGSDKARISLMDTLYQKALDSFSSINSVSHKQAKETLIGLYNEMGSLMQDICKDEKSIRVYSFVTAHASHAEASRLIAKLRDIRTGRESSSTTYSAPMSFFSILLTAVFQAPARTT